MKKIRLSEVFPIEPELLYNAWLSSREHTAFTGSEAEIDAHVGGSFSAWDSYISGRILELHPYRKIVQLWRTTDFDDKDPDSMLEIEIEAVPGGSRLCILHYGFPPAQLKAYTEGWEQFYLEPMRAYFASASSR